ncbi:MAG: hypothetical protein PVF05_10850 [Gemmatimonadales bacterium]|jgi:hypothetical protein
MNDKDRPIDERIAAAAREHYHEPPETPSDEMWDVIATRLDAAPADVTPLRPRAGGSPAARRARVPGHAGWWIGIAAALLIGLGLGRLTRDGGSGGAPAVAGRDASTETTVAAAPGESLDTATEAGVSAGERTAAPPSRDGETSGEAAVSTPRPNTAADRPADDAPRGRTSELPYRVATLKHLDRSESFLAMARAGLSQAEDDPGFGPWARALLARTRLLLASPAAEEPETRRLLQDLELMLAQIVVSVETGDPDETRITGEGLQDSDLLLRLRSVADGGPAKQGAVRSPGSSAL